MKKLNKGMMSSRSSEHLTPKIILDAVLETMRHIDLDPCAEIPDPGQPFNVPARTHYTKIDDGSSRLWHGNVYMNPPYGREIKKWVEWLMLNYNSGGLTQAIALVPARTDTKWWSMLTEDSLLCLIRGRLKFINEGNTTSAPFPSAVFYLGPYPADFIEAFAKLGDIWIRMRRSK